MESKSLIPIGSEIKVDKAKIENALLKKLLTGRPQIIEAKVIDYKMTDGMGIGYVVLCEDNLKIWIFSSELNKETIKQYKLNQTDSFKYDNNIFSLYNEDINYKLDGNKKIKYIINPINLINWIIFTLKDIV